MVSDNLCYVFQTDSEIVRRVYANENNYLVECDKFLGGGEKNVFALFISAATTFIFPIRKRSLTKGLLRVITLNGTIQGLLKRINIFSLGTFSSNGICQA